MEEGEQINHIRSTLSMVKQFHAEGKYYDVQLKVDDEIFKCQRSLLAAISEYFDIMFSSNFKESNFTRDQPITLHELNATAFKEILRFMYTGDILVNDFNVFELLLMNDFLRLRTTHIKEHCIKRVKSRSEGHVPMLNALHLYSFACMKAENILIDALNAHICQHLYHYSQDPKMMEIRFEDLNNLLKFSENYILSLRGSQNIVLVIILNWVNHDRKERKKYRDELMRNINFSNISSEFTQLFMIYLENFLDEVTDLPNDNELLEKFRSLKTEMVTDLKIMVDVQYPTRFSFVCPLNELNVNNEAVFSQSSIIFNLSWKISLMPIDSHLGFILQCDGTSDKTLLWNCCVHANICILSHKGEEESNLFFRTSYITFSHSKPIMQIIIHPVKWNELINLENEYVHDDLVVINLEFFADVPFQKI